MTVGDRVFYTAMLASVAVSGAVLIAWIVLAVIRYPLVAFGVVGLLGACWVVAPFMARFLERFAP